MAHVHGAAAKTAAHHHAAMQHTAHGAAAMARDLPSATQHAVKAAHITGAAAGLAATTQTATGKSVMSILAKHPVLVFSLGMAAGYLVHKYRKEIIESATRLTEQGKDFVLHQKENLEDLVAECKECADDAGSETAPS
jgi:hypothetical protein